MSVGFFTSRGRIIRKDSENAMTDSRLTTDKPKPKRKAPKSAFKPGKSGNPGGRKPKTEEERTLEQMCKEKTPEALLTILSIMAQSEQDRSKLAAAVYVIDRGWGKAKESVELSGMISVSIADQIKQTHAARKRE